MRIDRKSPRSSVTCWSLLSRQRGRAAWGSASERGLRMVGGIGQTTETVGDLGCSRGGRRARTLADPRESCAELVGRGRVELGERVPDDPGAVAVVGGGRALRLGSEGGLGRRPRSEEHTSELQSHLNLVCRLLLEKKKKNQSPALLLQKIQKKIQQ